MLDSEAVSGHGTSLYRFGTFQLDPRAHELRRDTIRLKIPEQCYMVLLKLLERPGELVTREELRLAVWPSDTFVDYDTGLNKIVKQLRQVLGDSVDAPAFIETAPKLGYRFIAPIDSNHVEETAHKAVDEATHKRDELVEPGKTEAGGRIGRRAVAAGLMAVAAIAGASMFVRQHAATESPTVEIVPLSGLQGIQDSPAFSPDGNQVAFVLNGAEGREGIYTTLVGGENPLRLTTASEFQDHSPVWSPDGQSIAFVRQEPDSQEAIYTVASLGGTLRKIYTFSPQALWVAGGFNEISWSPDGKQIAISETAKGSNARRVALVPIVEPTPHFITSPGPGYSDWAPIFSPDGRWIVFRRTTGPGLVDDLYLIPANGGETKRLTTDSVYIGSAPAWSTDSQDIIFTSMRAGMTALWRVSTSGGEPRRVAGLGALAFSPAISPKGNRLAFVNAIANSNLWTIDLSDPVRAASAAHPTVNSKGSNGLPSFSPDGQRIAFESTRSGFNEIWTAGSDGSNPTQVSFFRGDSGTPRWSYDGHHIAFDSRPKDHHDIYVADVSGTLVKKVVTFEGEDNFVPSWSRDGKWIYFGSTHASEQSDLWKIGFPGGTPVRLTTRGGIDATESEDGFIYFLRTQNSDEVWRVPMQGGPEQLVMKGTGLTCWCHLAVGKTGMYFTRNESPRHIAIYFYEFRTKKLYRIAGVKEFSGNIALAPDGKSLVYAQLDLLDETIMVMNHFR
jgi:Tol biopolymer transport system component/DNA-binding winged helix-turn-helix (wHTH) protein